MCGVSDKLEVRAVTQRDPDIHSNGKHALKVLLDTAHPQADRILGCMSKCAASRLRKLPVPSVCTCRTALDLCPVLGSSC